MNDEAGHAVQEPIAAGAGERLMRARENAGMTIEQLAAETRIPQRHLEVIESGRFEDLPARTYAIGFSRTYARAVGLDEKAIADQVREELGANRYEEIRKDSKFEPGDPARVPSRKLAWFSAFAVLLLVAGGLSFFRGYFFPGSGPGPITQERQVAQNERVDAPVRARDAARPTGQVVFTSLEDGVWVRFYDAAGDRLMEKQMSEGERYSIPQDVEGPQLWTGQPEALVVSIGGDRIGTLSEESEIVRDLPATATALIDRIEENRAQAARAGGNGSEDDTPAAG